MRLFRGIIVLVVLLFGVTVAAIEYTSQPPFCNSCHEMSPMYTSWAKSAHQEVKCLQCHAKPGIAGLVQTKMKGLAEVYKHLTNSYERPITISDDSWEFSQRCFKCHEAQSSGAAGGPHNERHLEMKLTCTNCHKGLVHDPQKNNQPPSREICVNCHGTQNPQTGNQ